MKGKIIIEHDESGTHISVNVKGAVHHDRIYLVHALGKALALEPIDYMVLAHAESEGALDCEGPAMVSVDRKELLKQLEEEQLES